MQSVDDLIEELNGLSMHNPLYKLKIDMLISLLHQRMRQGDGKSEYYKRVLMRYVGRYQKLNIHLMNIVYDAMRHYSMNRYVTDIPLSEYFTCRKQLNQVFRDLYSEEPDTPAGIKKFLREELMAIQGLPKGSQDFWNRNFYVTTFVVESKRAGTLDTVVCKEELSAFFNMKKYAIAMKQKMFSEMNDDLMKCFGDNVDAYGQLDVEKLKALYCYVEGGSLVDMAAVIMGKIMDSGNPLGIKSGMEEKVGIEVLSYIHSLESSLDAAELIECIYNDGKLLCYLPAKTKMQLRFYIYSSLKSIGDEVLQSFLTGYVKEKVGQGDAPKLLLDEYVKAGGITPEDAKAIGNRIEGLQQRRQYETVEIKKRGSHGDPDCTGQGS